MVKRIISQINVVNICRTVLFDNHILWHNIHSKKNQSDEDLNVDTNYTTSEDQPCVDNSSQPS